ncbi:DEAD/DEAH box helicase [Nemorincola caseinilytica]|uniref:RNA helicase n=1 Tax=Nemorincola caseinilytica TaxID=2054315 RepID=A0ABP8NPK1_9BACT
MTSFSSFSLREELTQAISDLGFETPTPIQQKVIPTLLTDPQDIIGLAQTGTGKTAAFGLPLLHHVDVSERHVQCLVLSPTRELCMQIQEEMGKYGAYMRGLRITAVYGGMPIGGQIRELKGHPQVVVATPGRLIDLLERKAISLDDVKYVVLDEADEMLNMGFREDIDLILKNTPSREHTWLFSATMSNEVRGIAKRFMKDWKEFASAAANTTNENIDHQYYVTQHHNRFETLRRLLDFTPGIYGIIFTRTKQDCQEIAEKLMKMGYHVSPLHGDMDQKMRSKVMERFKNKSLQCLVATDVAARGIDVNDITHVINYELPDDPEVYTHRSGRTARAGKSGICMSIVSPKQISNIRQIERMVKQKFHKSDIPDGAEVVRKRLFFYMEQIASAEPRADFAKLYRDSIHEQFADVDKDELIRKLIWLQLRDTIDVYQDSDDLNAGYESKERSGRGGRFARIFINLGEKDGLSAQKLVQFITESTDIESNVIERVTVRELSSFFNVPGDAAPYIIEQLSSKKFKGRKVRLEETDQNQARGYAGGGGGYRGGDRPKPGPRYSNDIRSYGDRNSGGGGGGYKGRKRSS